MWDVTAAARVSTGDVWDDTGTMWDVSVVMRTDSASNANLNQRRRRTKSG